MLSSGKINRNREWRTSKEPPTISAFGEIWSLDFWSEAERCTSAQAWLRHLPKPKAIPVKPPYSGLYFVCEFYDPTVWDDRFLQTFPDYSGHLWRHETQIRSIHPSCQTVFKIKYFCSVAKILKYDQEVCKSFSNIKYAIAVFKFEKNLSRPDS